MLPRPPAGVVLGGCGVGCRLRREGGAAAGAGRWCWAAVHRTGCTAGCAGQAMVGWWTCWVGWACSVCRAAARSTRPGWAVARGAVPRAPSSGPIRRRRHGSPGWAWHHSHRTLRDVGLPLRDGGLAGGSGGPVRREGRARGGRDAGADLPQPRLQLGVDPVATAGDRPGLCGLRGAGGDGASGADQLGGPGGLVVRVDGRRGIGVPGQAVAPVALPGTGDVRGQDLVRRVADVLAGDDAGVPAVRGGHRHVAEQLVPLGELVAGLALVGADGAGVESADVGQQGGDFAAVHGQPLRSGRLVEGSEQGGGVGLGPGHAAL